MIIVATLCLSSTIANAIQKTKTANAHRLLSNAYYASRGVEPQAEFWYYTSDFEQRRCCISPPHADNLNDEKIQFKILREQYFLTTGYAAGFGGAPGCREAGTPSG